MRATTQNVKPLPEVRSLGAAITGNLSASTAT
jgi:hypothetical protein